MPFALVSLLGVLALVTVVVSVGTSGRYSYFSTPRPGRADVVREFRSALENTLEARSFQYDESPGRIDYQAPNRTRALDPLGPSIVIGHTVYVALGFVNNKVTQWGEGPLTAPLDNVFGLMAVRRDLKDLLGVTSVHRRGDHFYAQQVVAADTVSPGTNGQALIDVTVIVRSGHVVRVEATAHGILTSYKLAHDAYRAVTVTSIYLGRDTYSQFGEVPPITAPTSAKIIHLQPCTNGYRFRGIAGHKYICAV